ncbi:hypothetical protein [Spirosoma sordidisoli]|uniref:Uncharacterized protein n=1 Tax=Spirosoma sordidisoli TaxID=2502893 RepID=A0A4Q2UUZ3_9BACT|nr:hypothetical protein [Spirosoma sordidisoli]RYC70729.1 hypothetical protein EQG79_00825 [Spirosoma sordidisoli]
MDRQVIMVTTEESLRALAYMVADIIRSDEKKPDTERFIAVELAKKIGIGPRRVRTAIAEGHYGTVYTKGGRTMYYGTVTEARAYHFENISKKKTPARNQRLS